MKKKSFFHRLYIFSQKTLLFIFYNRLVKYLLKTKFVIKIINIFKSKVKVIDIVLNNRIVQVFQLILLTFLIGWHLDYANNYHNHDYRYADESHDHDYSYADNYHNHDYADESHTHDAYEIHGVAKSFHTHY
jgi:hypothetical protein